MLNICVTLKGADEVVQIDWYGAKPVLSDLMSFLESQYPGAIVEIDQDGIPVYDDDHRFEVHKNGEIVYIGSSEACSKYCSDLMQREEPSLLFIMNRETGELYEAATF